MMVPHHLFYRIIVGMLQYTTIIRSDISFVVNKISQFFAQPFDGHWQSVKRILRYVTGILHLGIELTKSSYLHHQAYCDANWTGDPDDRQSTIGFAIFLGSNLISWSSKKQTTLSRSSTETEYRAMAITTAKLMWI
jgi:hypothetical protein